MRLGALLHSGLCALWVAGCGGGQIKESGNPLDGFGDLKFGMSFDQALTATSTQMFNPYGLRECLSQLPIRGCLLVSGDNVASIYTRVEGIPYGLALDFNRFDQLTDIHLKFNRDGYDSENERISSSDCLSVHERTIDWISQRYGAVTAPRKDDSVTVRRTEGARTYPISLQKNGDFLSLGLIKVPENREISILSHFMTIDGKPICRIDLEFSDSKSVERRKYVPE